MNILKVNDVDKKMVLIMIMVVIKSTTVIIDQDHKDV